MNLKEYDWSAVLGNIGKIATVFNPAIGGGLMVASQVVDRFESDVILSDDFCLENNVIGLTRCAEILDFNLQKVELKQDLDIEQLKLVSQSLKSLILVIDKTSKILR